MGPETRQDSTPSTWLPVFASGVRAAFGVIGAIFAAVYPDGDPAHALTGVSTYPVGPGEGVVFDLVIRQPGKYVFVDHDIRNVLLGASGVLEVH